MKCEDLLAALNDFVDGDVDPGICDVLREHLAECNPCKIVVDNIRQTIVLYKEGEPLEMPAECQKKLHEAVRARWKDKFAGGDCSQE